MRESLLFYAPSGSSVGKRVKYRIGYCIGYMSELKETPKGVKAIKQFNRNIKDVEPFRVSPLAEKITKIGICTVARIAMTISHIRRGCKKR